MAIIEYQNSWESEEVSWKQTLCGEYFENHWIILLSERVIGYIKLQYISN